MFDISTITVTVPGTTANLGPGFDCIGAALTLYNQFKFTPIHQGENTEVLNIAVTGAEAARVDTSSENLVYQAFLKVYHHLELPPPPVKIDIELAVPLARGLGSSATAIVGGLVGANLMAGEPLERGELMKLAIAIEGHPDNVVPALLGGCRLAATTEDGGWEICDVPWHDRIIPVLAIPDFELSTQEARAVLPKEFSRADAIFNVAHLGLLLRGLETGREDWLRSALQDRFHQPYRQSLISGYEDVRAAALKEGALGMAISGAGPTLIALADATKAEAVARAMAQAWAKVGITSAVRSLSIDWQGTKTAIGSGG
ncbi:MAG TPA: homoserine kinase [Cyanobacteria bacterium UBA11149]|nr:homoserine kinase [Cyanobacteria bacterium UBA11367]HBE57641.1 homoserine kinase [Cyanobacteria bacterium UBA11366]HBK63606.1 homoserine kinase [Cyanobacteria bacterium UBA11166]HBR73102.1 homoserine kinase [Cyanobacteria bacterium UBA11159]HBS68012.1 homoserine kinase [Cyanobacteria bacterium UBA11153]HBW87558.1 homoserine kinase [Cyanobacteria bacterium UBA11149]HCA94422.1 homoserine kinase [Cyanobacteria bacterium UBA9226]